MASGSARYTAQRASSEERGGDVYYDGIGSTH